MPCPDCESKNTKVASTPGERRHGFIRYRQCIDCGHRFPTIERPYDSSLYRDGMSLYALRDAQGLPAGQIEDLAGEIKAEAAASVLGISVDEFQSALNSAGYGPH